MCEVCDRINGGERKLAAAEEVIEEVEPFRPPKLTPGEFAHIKDTKPGCKDQHCNKKSKARGYCQKHYVEARDKGVFDDDGKFNCTKPGCIKLAVTRGLCGGHYKNARNTGEIEVRGYRR